MSQLEKPNSPARPAKTPRSPKPTKPKKPKATPLAVGNVLTLLSSTAFISTFVDVPHGANARSFIVIGVVASLIGYNAGTWLGDTETKKAVWGLIIAAVFVPAAYYGYDVVVDRGSGGLLIAAAVYFLFAACFLVCFAAFGILQVAIFKVKSWG